MNPTLAQVYTLLSLEDEITVLELLDISSEELVDAFKHKVRERKAYLNKHYEEDIEEERTCRKHNEASGLGSKEVWTQAGFEKEGSDWD